MKIEQGGSQRWLVIESRSVDNMWPAMLGFLSQLGLSARYQNQNIGVIQTDWATRNSNVSQTDVRALFQWVGWGEMYSMPTQYMFRVTMWQSGKDVQIFVTSIQMSEVYPGCGRVVNSTVETSDRQITRWMPLPPNPQLDLEFLMQFMAFSGLTPQQIKSVKTDLQTESKALFESATAIDGKIIVNDNFDRAWWRVAVALDRVGLGIADRNRATGEYYVYPMQSRITAPSDGFFSKLFGSSGGKSLKIPDASYTVKLLGNGDKTILTIVPVSSNVDAKTAINQYLASLAKQLY
jgi:outer membrane protein assembly factor BamC